MGIFGGLTILYLFYLLNTYTHHSQDENRLRLA